MQELAQRHQRRGLVGQARRQPAQRRERARRIARALEQAGELDLQRRHVGTQRHHRRQAGPRLVAITAPACPDRKLVHEVGVLAPILREVGEHPVGFPLPAGRVVEAHGRAPYARQRPAARGQRLQARDRRQGQPGIRLFLSDGQRRRPARGIDRQRLPPRLQRPGIAPRGARGPAQPREQQRAPLRRRLRVQRPLEHAAALVVVIGGLGGGEAQGRLRPARRQQLERPGKHRRRGPVVAVARRRPGEHARQVDPRPPACTSEPPRPPFQQGVQRVDPRCRLRRAPRQLGGRWRRGCILPEAERSPRPVGDAREQPPRAVGDHGLDQDPVPAAPEPDADRILVQRRGANDVARKDRRAVDPDLDRPGRAQPQRGRLDAVAAHERHRVGDGLVRGPEQAVQVQHAVAHRRVAPAPAGLVCLSRIVRAQDGRRRLLLGRKRRVEAGAPLAERTDDEIVRQQAQRGAQRGRFLRFAALVEQARQEPRGVRRDQRMRARRQPTTNRGLQRPWIDVLLQRRERGERARALGLRPLRRQPGRFRRQQVVVRTRLRGTRAEDGDRAENQRRRCAH